MRRMTRIRRGATLALACALVGCGATPGAPPGKPPDQPFVLSATAGTWSDGSGRLGLAMLATLRDHHGAGPDSTWMGSLLAPSGATLASEFSYDDGAPGSVAVWWWPEVPTSPRDHYTLTLSEAGSTTVATDVAVQGNASLGLPAVDLSSDGNQLTWPAVPGAAAYACRVYAGGNLQVSTVQANPGCDVSALPPGAYSASILAFSADPSSLRADTAQTPKLPDGFQVTESKLSFAHGSSGSATARLLAAGGEIRYGGSTPGLAIWLSIAQPDGTPTNTPWAIEVLGPGLPSTSPLRFTYPPSLPRYLTWSYDVNATPGLYTFTATSGATSLSGRFSVGQPAGLDLPSDVSARSLPSGAAAVSWTPVAGARSYYVSVWSDSLAQFQQGQWVVGTTSASFPSGTFTAGTSYDVYVAATDADMTSGTPPSQVSVSENTYLPATFIAR